MQTPSGRIPVKMVRCGRCNIRLLLRTNTTNSRLAQVSMGLCSLITVWGVMLYLRGCISFPGLMATWTAELRTGFMLGHFPTAISYARGVTLEKTMIGDRTMEHHRIRG